MLRIITILLLLVLPLAARAQDVHDLGATLQPIIEKHNVPGMSALVLVGDTVTARGVAGVRKAGDPEKIAPADLFHLGSCTKSMTATMIATLVEEGTLKWSTTVGETFPDLPMHDKWKGVRLDQLLTHTSGAPYNLDRDALWSRLWRHPGTPTEQRLALVTGVTSWEPESEPGTRFLYSNAGFAIAGAMAETVTGTSWEDLMRERLFKPLGMTTAGFGPPGKRGSLDQPRGHRDTNPPRPVEPGRDADNPAAIAPAGAVHCSMDDWAKYIALHLGKNALLKPETFTTLHTPAKIRGARTDYALGWSRPKRAWATIPGGTGRVLTHNGSNTMWFCVAWIAPEKNFAVLVACNRGGTPAEQACDEAAGALIKWHTAQSADKAAPN